MARDRRDGGGDEQLAEASSTAGPDAGPDATPDATMDVEGSTTPPEAGDAPGSDVGSGEAGCTVGLDPTFGTAGVVELTTPTRLQAFNPNGVLVQPDGKILVGGTSSPEAWFLARVDSAGAVDTTFGTGGYATAPNTNATVQAILARPTGGNILVVSTQLGPEVIQVAQFTSAGTLDTTFGTGGVVTTSFSGVPNVVAHAAVLQPDGMLVVGGSASTTSEAGTVTQIAMARYTTTGTLDSTFGTGGHLLTDLGLAGGAGVGMLALQSNGSIVISLGISGAYGAARLTTAGQVDTSFGTGGVVRTPMLLGSSDYSVDLLVLPGDAVVLAGQAGTTTDAGFVGDLGLAKLTAAGVVEGTFGGGGHVVTSIAGQPQVYVKGAGLTPSGKVVVVGNGTVPGDAGPVEILDLAQYACP